MLEPEKINEIIHKQVNNELPRPADGFKSLAAEKEHKARVERRFLELHKEFERIQKDIRNKNTEMVKVSFWMILFFLLFVALDFAVVLAIVHIGTMLFNAMRVH